MAHAIVKTVRLREHSKLLSTDLLRGVGFRAVCGDHWQGSRRMVYRSAALDARAHNKEAHR